MYLLCTAPTLNILTITITTSTTVSYTVLCVYTTTVHVFPFAPSLAFIYNVLLWRIIEKGDVIFCFIMMRAFLPYCILFIYIVHLFVFSVAYLLFCCFSFVTSLFSFLLKYTVYTVLLCIPFYLLCIHSLLSFCELHT